MSTDNRLRPNARTDTEPDAAIDVALDVALELADDAEVRQHIRRAQQERVTLRYISHHVEDGGSL